MNDNNNTESVLYAVGTRGYSAYEVAVQNGFIGTEEEWLDSLVGPEGPQGQPFDELTPEQKAEIKGPQGYSAYEVAVQNGFIGTEEDFVNSYINAENYYNKEQIDNKNEVLQTNIDIVETDLETEITNRQTENTSLSNRISALASGSPLPASDISEMIDTSKIYVNTTDGYCYYYDGNDWQQGWIYQSTVDSTSIDNILKDINIGLLTENSNNLFNIEFKKYSKINNSDGSFDTDETYLHNIATEDYLEITGNLSYNFYCKETVGIATVKWLYFYDADKTMIPATNNNYLVLTHNTSFKAPEDAKYIRLSFSHSTLSNDELYNLFLKTAFIQTIDEVNYVYPKLIGTDNIDYDFKELNEFRNQVLSKQTGNLFNDEFIPTARFGSSTGRFINADGLSSYSVHKKFIPVIPEEVYIFSNPDSSNKGVNKTMFCYDINKEYISKTVISMDSPITIPSNCYYIRFQLTHTINTPATDLPTMPKWMFEKGSVSHWYLPPKMIETKNIDYDFNSLETLKTTVSTNTNRIADLEEAIDNPSGKNIYETPLVNGLQRAVSLNKTNKYVNIGYFTDTHDNVNDASKSIVYMNKLSLSNICNMCIHGGDIISSYSMNYNQFIEAMLNSLNNYKQMKNLYFVKGNHDNNHSTTAINNLTKSEYNMLFNVNLNNAVYNKNDPYGNYYYVDDKINKIRIIILDSFYLYSDYSNVNYGSAQTTWLYQTALNTDDLEDYSVIIFSHYYTRTSEIVDILKAFNHKGATYGSYVFDESSNAKLVALIHGHNHYDSYNNTDGFNVIGVTKAFSNVEDIGTNDETAIDIFTIDTDNDILYETRIGKGSNRSYSYGDNSSFLG